MNHASGALTPTPRFSFGSTEIGELHSHHVLTAISPLGGNQTGFKLAYNRVTGNLISRERRLG